MAQLVKNLPAMQETCWEDPLEKGKATHSSILAWRIPWTVQSMGLQRLSAWLSDFHFHFHNKRRWADTLLDHASSTFCETDSLQNTTIKKKKNPGPPRAYAADNKELPGRTLILPEHQRNWWTSYLSPSVLHMHGCCFSANLETEK